MKVFKSILLISLLILGIIPSISAEEPDDTISRSGPYEIDTPVQEMMFTDPYALDGWFFKNDALLWHSNGNYYEFDAQSYNIDEDDNEYDLRLTFQTVDIERNIFGYEYYRLPSISREDGSISSIREHFFEGENGDIYGLVIVQTGSYSSSFIDPDHYIMVHLENTGDGNFEIDSWYLGKIMDTQEYVMDLLNIGDRYFIPVHFNESWHIIPFIEDDTFNRTFKLEDRGSYGLSFDIMEIGEELAFVKQDGLGKINVTFLDEELNITHSIEIDAYPGGIGHDNYLNMILEGEDIHIFVNRDLVWNVDNYGFRFLDHFEFTIHGTQLRSHKNIELGGASNLYYIEPILIEDNFLIIDASTNSIYLFDLEMNPVRTYTLGGEVEWLKNSAELEIKQFRNNTIIIGSYDIDLAWGITIYDKDEIPGYGSFTLVADQIIKNTMIGPYQRIHVIEGVKATFEDVNIQQYGNFEETEYSIYNYGDLVLKDVTFVSDDEIEFYNYGTLTLENVTMEADFEGNGEITFIGSNNSIGEVSYRYSDYYEWSNITFKNVDQRYLGEKESDMDRLLEYLNDEGHFNVRIENGYFLDQEDVIGGSAGTATFVNCSFTRSDILGNADHLVFENCEFNEVKDISSSSYASIVFTNCSFINCDGALIRIHGSVDMIDCTFEDTDHFTYASDWGCDILHINVTRSSFRSCTSLFEVEGSGSIHIKESTFDDCVDIFNSLTNAHLRVHYNNFINCTRIFAVGLYDVNPILFKIHDNRFIGGELIAYIDRDPMDEEDLFDYEDEDEVLSDNHIPFYDLSNNIWDTDDPGVVASRLTFGFKFLPFRTIHGEEISTNDNDIDGMEDEWEIENNLDPCYYYDRFMDNDKDGYSNYEEFRAGYDPMNNNSSPGADFMEKRVIPWVVLASILFALLFVIFFPMNRIWRGTETFNGRVFQQRWLPGGHSSVGRIRPVTLRYPDKGRGGGK